MTEADVGAVAELEKAVFSDAWTANSIHDTLCQKQAFGVAAEDAGKLTGYCMVYFVMEEAEIARIAVEASCRRQGIGREILDQVCLACRERGVTRLLLDVREGNETARRFYEDYGFRKDGIRRNFYDRPREHAVLMSLALG